MKWWRKKRWFALLFLVVVMILFSQSDWIGRWMYPIHYREDIMVSARNYGVDPYLVAAIIRVETNYKVGKVSKKGALGIMQLMPDTADWVIEQAGFKNVTLQDIEHRADIGIEAGTWYLRSLARQFDGNMYAVIASYNAGPGHVRKWLNEQIWDGTYESAGQIPFGETRHYMARVMYYYQKYKKYHAD
jgi:soluble lytic murein transglycosylase